MKSLKSKISIIFHDLKITVKKFKLSNTQIHRNLSKFSISIPFFADVHKNTIYFLNITVASNNVDFQ
jgi:hypothetical protein